MRGAGPSKKPRLPEGADITRFFDRTHHAEQETGAHHANRDEAPSRHNSPSGRGVAAAAAAPPDGAPQHAAAPAAAAAPARSALHKHLTALQDLVPADSFAMSQDTDAMQVVWHDSPGASSQHQARTVSNLGRPAAAPRGAAVGGGAQELSAIKQRLISAAQKPRDVRRPGPPLPGAGRLQQSEQFLEGLLARQQQQQPDVAALAGAAPPPPAEHSNHSGAHSDLAVAGGGSGGGAHRTPATHLRGILKRRGGGSGGRGRQTPASSVKFSLNQSSGKRARHRGGAGAPHAGSSGKKRQAGQKRKALLDLLEQVESIVSSGPSPRSGDEGQGGQQTPGGARLAAPAPPADDPGAVSDKENSADAAPAGRPCSSQEQAGGGAAAPPAHAGPTGSQQLMPPPGGVRCCGGQQAVATSSHHGQQPPQQVPEPAAAAAVAGPQRAQQRPLATAQVGQTQGSGGSGGSGGFAGDDDEEDALMARLELELLTQVEQRQAAARHGWPAQPERSAPAAKGAPLCGAYAQPAPARLQAAPPAAQHPAAAVQQQRQQQQRRQAAAAAQPRPLPRSPYDKALKAQALTAQALPKGAPAAPGTAPGAAPAAAVCTAALQGSDSSWDDDGFDAHLLDQFEAAALKERAGRSGQGQPSAGGSDGAGGTAAAEDGSRPPTAAAAAAAAYPGDRAEVRYRVQEVFSDSVEQVLLLHNKYQKRDVYAHLRAPWTDLPYRVGDSVNLLAELDFFEGNHHCLLSMEQGMLILHPDVLLSGTRITTSHECPRRSFLDERVAGDGSNDKAVKGTLTHNLIQAALTEGLRTPTQLVARAERVVCEATEALLEVELSEEAAMECLRQAVPGIQRWMHRFLRADPAPDSLLGAGMDYGTGRDIRRMVAVQEVVDIEESIWSTKFGVKGMIDVSTQLVLDEVGQAARGAAQPAGGWVQAGAAAQQAAGAAAGREGRQVTVAPVEIKTGKMHDSHRAQVLLYLLLMEERYGKPLDWGMLWYTTQTDPQLVLKRPTDMACLMAVRNRLAAAIAHREMPPLTEEKRQCGWCFQQLNCAMAFKAERGEAATGDSFVRPSTDRGGNLDRVQQELAAKYERATGHMTPADCEFLKKWEALVTLEDGHSSSRRPEIWAMEGQQRQQLGRCVAGLALSHVDEEQLLYTFCRPDGAAVDCGFQEGEMLLLSVEGQHVAVARGFFYTCTASHMTVSLNKPMRRGLLAPSGAPPGAAPAGGAVAFDASVRWRVDRDEVSSTFVRLRGNLFALFRREYQAAKDPQTNRVAYGPELPESQHAAKLRRLVVALEAPRFAAADPTQPDPTPPGMNSEQHEAVRRVLRARDYALVLGMPGAGKTTTIVSMVQALVAQGKRVLLTSYTNSAVDNILMKLAGEEVPFVRLGRLASVHPAVRPWTPGGERYPLKATRELARLADSVPVFGATCFGVNQAMLKDRLFDVCIIDEAGQMVLPAALGPLLKARSFVLVGDHNQLPPLVTSKEAEAGGLGESLFKRLSEAHPQAVVSLPVQYRMAADIMLLPNTLIYDHALRCGTDGIAQAALQLGPAAAATLATWPGWLREALDPQRRVLFLDTAHVEEAREAVAGDAMSNGGEARLVLQLLQAAVAAGVPQQAMGVISPYRSQVALLDRLARGAGLGDVEVLTVDKCQGRDKDFVAISLVRSNAEAEAGKLLADWRRINVAITRAKCKLVLVGDASTLSSIPLFGRLVALVQERGWYRQLPADAAAPAPQPMQQ